MREAGKTPCGARQNRERAAGPLILGYRRITLRASAAGGSCEWAEINDHRGWEISRTEFGLPLSHMKDAFGNEGALPLFSSHRARRFRNWISSRSIRCLLNCRLKKIIPAFQLHRRFCLLFR